MKVLNEKGPDENNLKLYGSKLYFSINLKTRNNNKHKYNFFLKNSREQSSFKGYLLNPPDP